MCGQKRRRSNDPKRRTVLGDCPSCTRDCRPICRKLISFTSASPSHVFPKCEPSESVQLLLLLRNDVRIVKGAMKVYWGYKRSWPKLKQRHVMKEALQPLLCRGTASLLCPCYLQSYEAPSQKRDPEFHVEPRRSCSSLGIGSMKAVLEPQWRSDATSTRLYHFPLQQ